jgi:2C-methyl-D-erythritol 2,4-cyclodiphosphate synthase
MVDKIGKALGIGADRVNVKATSPEGLGFSGRGEGIIGQSVVLVEAVGKGNPDVEDL